MILGGENKNNESIDEYFEYLLYDIVGNDTFYRFMIDLKQASYVWEFLHFPGKTKNTQTQKGVGRTY